MKGVHCCRQLEAEGRSLEHKSSKAPGLKELTQKATYELSAVSKGDFLRLRLALEVRLALPMRWNYLAWDWSQSRLLWRN